MNKPRTLALFFGNNHDHEKNTQPHFPVVDGFMRSMEPTVEIFAVVSPEVSLTGGQFPTEQVRRLTILGDRLIASAVNEPLNVEEIGVVYDRTGTLTSDWPVPVLNDRSVRQAGQGKDEGELKLRDQLARELVIPTYFGTDNAEGDQVRIYHHVAPEPEVNLLWTPVAYRMKKGKKHKPVYRTLDVTAELQDLRYQSHALTSALVDACGQTDAVAATAWVKVNGIWTMIAPNTGNVLHGGTTLEQDAGAYKTRENVGKHLAAILLRAA